MAAASTSARRSRRELLTLGVASLASSLLARDARAARSAQIKPPAETGVERWDFDGRATEGWTVVDGRWTVEDVQGSPSGKRVLVHRSSKKDFGVIVAPLGPYTDVDVAVKFMPISGREDASGGIVFRFLDGRYYVVRANALEDNFRFYYYDGRRHLLATARVRPPALARWHTMRVVAVGDRIRGWLDGALSLDHRDTRFTVGRIGLWTKADSMTAFDELEVRGAPVRP